MIQRMTEKEVMGGRKKVGEEAKQALKKELGTQLGRFRKSDKGKVQMEKR